MAASPLSWLLLARRLLKPAGQAGAAAWPAGAGWAAVALALAVALGLAGTLAGCDGRGAGAGAAAASAAGGLEREVDFGFVELDHGGRAVAVASYKHGGAMMLRAGEVLHFQAIGDPPLPALELHLAGRIILLPGASGQLKIEAGPGSALPAVMRAQGDRLSLPGGAPPRVSVKVQITGPPRAEGR